jgi:hypothetical protein
MKYSPRGIAIRLFFTCWLIFSVHFATNIVREIYLALAIGDHFSFRVDEYANMHPDLFEKEGYGWHIGNNPGASMFAAVPYAIARPIIDRIVEKVNQARFNSGQTEPPSYDSPWPMAQEFYKEAWLKGYDVKFALAAFVMQVFCMAPFSALGVVVMFYVLRVLFASDRTALGLSLLFAFGTPVFFRTGYLNQNLMLGFIGFLGFLTIWDPYKYPRWSIRTRYFLAGLCGGTALLFDYSGAVILIGLFVYGFLKQWLTSNKKEAFRLSAWYLMGSIPPVLLLWLYQWRSFGDPFLPGQHWMPPVEWIELGYQGYGLPQLELFLLLGFDYRYGFFVTSPLFLLALAAPFVDRGNNRRLPRFELYFILSLFLAFWIFFSGSNYTRLQFNTGLRYMTPMLPFLFLPAVVVLMRLPGLLRNLIVLFSFVQAWAMAMYREVESSLGILEPIVRFFLGGFQLPVLRTISRMDAQFGYLFPNGISALPLLFLVSCLILLIWLPGTKIRQVDG